MQVGALEFVLYGTGSDGLATAEEPDRCAYGAAISGNLDKIAAELDAAWSAPDGLRPPGQIRPRETRFTVTARRP